jgi:hypothetical protein
MKRAADPEDGCAIRAVSADERAQPPTQPRDWPGKRDRRRPAKRGQRETSGVGYTLPRLCGLGFGAVPIERGGSK